MKILHSFKSLLFIIPFMLFLSGYLILDTLFRSEELEAPALIGMNIQEAVTLLSTKNLNLRLLATKEDPILDPGTIISQSPHTGQKIKENQSVYVVTVTKPKKLKAPQVVNKSLQEIQELLQSTKIRAKYYYMQSPYPKDMCFAQSPAPAQELDESNKMIVYIATSNNKPIIMPDFKGKNVQDVADFLTTQSAKVTIFHYPPMADHTCLCVITDQRPMAGSIITPLVDKPLQVQLQARMP